MKKLLVLIFMLIIQQYTFCKAPVLLDKSQLKAPPRIIRTCCSFGADVKVMFIPGIRVTDITELEHVGAHHYLGNKDEGNGIIYTFRGGFIDLGHLRDMADWTAYLYNFMQNNLQGEIVIKRILGREGGAKSLDLNLPPDISEDDLITLAGKIAYDLSLWHEIATWFGASTVPLVPERYSSFSIEDAYSNLLGVTLGMKAIRSDLSYEDAMTNFISEILDSLWAVNTYDDTYNAMLEVDGVWWSGQKKLPGKRVLIERSLEVSQMLEPRLIPGWEVDCESKLKLKVPEFTSNGTPLVDLYQLGFKLNGKFPFRKMFPKLRKRKITEEDFDVMLARVESDLTRMGLLY